MNALSCLSKLSVAKPIDTKGEAHRSKEIANLLASLAMQEKLSSKLYQAIIASQDKLQPAITEWCTRAQDEDNVHLQEINKHMQRLNIQAVLPTVACPSSGNACAADHCPVPALINKLTFLETESIRAYSRLCDLCMEYDYRLFDLSYRHLQENLQHLQYAEHLREAC